MSKVSRLDKAHAGTGPQVKNPTHAARNSRTHMPDFLEFHDSTIVSLSTAQQSLHIGIDAYVHRWLQVEGQWIGRGWIQPVRLKLSTAGAPPNLKLPADLSTGSVELDGRVHDNILQLPCRSLGPARITFTLITGELIEVTGSEFDIEAIGEGRLLEDLPFNGPPVHDSLLRRYTVDGAAKTITLHTEPHKGGGGAFVDVIFTGVVAYQFEGDAMANIVSGIELAEAARYEDVAKIIIEQHRQYGVMPTWKSDVETLGQFCERNDLKLFEIQCSYGIDGWIIAANEARTIRDNR